MEVLESLLLSMFGVLEQWMCASSDRLFGVIYDILLISTIIVKPIIAII